MNIILDIIYWLLFACSTTTLVFTYVYLIRGRKPLKNMERLNNEAIALVGEPGFRQNRAEYEQNKAENTRLFDKSNWWNRLFYVFFIPQIIVLVAGIIVRG